MCRTTLSKKLEKKTQFINKYNKYIRREYIWNGNIRRIEEVLEDVNWELII